LPSDPFVLGFDTSAAHCAAALLRGDRCVAGTCEAIPSGQAERLFPILEAVLAAGGAGWRDLALIGVGTGPGNFTGLRVGVAAARGLALGLGIPAIGVPTPEARALGLPRPVAVVEPAGRGRIHLAPDGGTPELSDPETAAGRIGAMPLTGDAAEAVAAQSGGPVLAPAMPLAEAVARLAAARAEAAGRQGARLARPAPHYLHPPDAAPPAEAPPPLLP